MIHIHQVAGLAFFLFEWLLLIEGQGKGMKPPEVTYDHMGYCYVTGVNQRGRCVPQLKCANALKNWLYHEKEPSICYFNEYEKYICCSDPNIVETTTKAHAPKNSTLIIKKNSPFEAVQKAPKELDFPRFSDLPEPIKESRISEQECMSFYSDQPIRRRRHSRSKRSSDLPEIGLRITTSDLTAEEKKLFEKTHTGARFAKSGISTYSNEFPFMCALGWRTFSFSRPTDITYNCGCALISRNVVLTVAHCANLGGEMPFVVLMGGVDLNESNAERRKIKSIITHPEYDPKYAYNDIAIIKLDKSTRAVPACLWQHKSVPDELLTAIGYGQTKFAGPSSETLLKIFLNVTTNDNCQTFHQSDEKLTRGIVDGQMCAGDPEGKMDTCQGDSGGPILINVSKYNTMVPYIVGLTSYGKSCATGTPSVYTRISYYLDWIESEVWKEK